jgi:hypothetical protein
MLARRTFLWASTVTLASVGLLGTAVWVRGTVLRPPAQPLRYLSLHEFSILAAVADRLVRGPGIPSAADLLVAENVDGVLARMHPADAGEVRSVLHLLENALAGLVLDGRISTFTGSPPEVQDRVLAAWSRARVPLFRTAYRALHSLCLGAAWGNPAMYAHAGYPGPPVALLTTPLGPERPPVEPQPTPGVP